MNEKTKQEIKETVNKLANANLDFTIEDELEFAKVAVKNAERKLEQVKQENKRLLEIINAKPLETVDMDSAFEIENLKVQLMQKSEVDMFFNTPIEGWNNDPCRICTYKQHYQAKEQECEELKKEINGYKTTIEKIRQEFQEGITCESRECGCDNYEECIECLKTTILDIIYDERNDFVEGREICKECGNYKQALDEIEEYCKKRL